MKSSSTRNMNNLGHSTGNFHEQKGKDLSGIEEEHRSTNHFATEMLIILATKLSHSREIRDPQSPLLAAVLVVH
ncbi:hypothetical protein GUJ93_ZPchr0011g26966 [Zizania palustris]|uniref:Uncharacterized protein n=1 Tax=Zizania palustris TaxID=103762 RepID=A0A8J6BRL2_ZIZPA|nr:hypothetical protein GUJ93_ZPchr0011g26966 [Zizania palustris]